MLASRGLHSACCPAPETALRGLTLPCSRCCSCYHPVSRGGGAIASREENSSTFQWERASPRKAVGWVSHLTSPLPPTGPGSPQDCWVEAALFYVSFFPSHPLIFLLLLSSELFASFSASFLLPLYFLGFPRPPAPFPLALPFI